MNVREQAEKILSENNVNFFKGYGETENVFNLPYRGISNSKHHINIYMEFIEELNIIKFMLIEKANKNIDLNDLKSSLLNINSLLNFGTLSMRNDSDTVEYKVDYQLNTEDFSFEQYQKFIVCCIKTYENLKNDDLIL